MSRYAMMLAGLIACGCTALPWDPQPAVSDSACIASCGDHFKQCPQMFAAFPERGAIECPAEHDNCMKACAKRRTTAPVLSPRAASADPPVEVAPGAAPAPPATSTKESQLRELKRLYDEGLVTEDVYKDRQRAILSQP